MRSFQFPNKQPSLEKGGLIFTSRQTGLKTRNDCPAALIGFHKNMIFSLYIQLGFFLLCVLYVYDCVCDRGVTVLLLLDEECHKSQV